MENSSQKKRGGSIEPPRYNDYFLIIFLVVSPLSVKILKK